MTRNELTAPQLRCLRAIRGKGQVHFGCARKLEERGMVLIRSHMTASGSSLYRHSYRLTGAGLIALRRANA